jgi:hypothetical protein
VGGRGLRSAISRIVVQEKDFAAKLDRLVLEPNYLSSHEFTKSQAAELYRWALVVEASGCKPDRCLAACNEACRVASALASARLNSA